MSEHERETGSSLASPTLPLPPPGPSEHARRPAAAVPVVPGERFERRVPPQHATLVTVRVKPQAVCFFYHPDSPERRLQFDADNRGIVRFHARALPGAGATEFRLEAHGAAGAELHTIALSADPRCTPQVSAPDLAAEPLVTGTGRPPLAGDPLAPSDAELVARGYPPRPDPAKSPARYSRWLQNVSRSFTIVDGRRVAHPEYGRSSDTHTPARQAAAPIRGAGAIHGAAAMAAGSQANQNSFNWCGPVLTKPKAQFCSIQADWNTPTVVAVLGGPLFSAMVEWVGLDDGKGDLYQAGTGTECYSILLWEITNYFMWMESLPWSWWVVPNFPVSPGDQILVEIWVADQFGTSIFKNGDWGGLTPQDNSVWFYLANTTNGASFMGTYPTAPVSQSGEKSTGFTGTTAEFILERPLINGSLPDLALFLSPAVMTNCSYEDSQSGDTEVFAVGVDGGPPPLDGTLTYFNMIDPNNNNALLAVPVSIPDPHDTADAQALWFMWVNFQ